MCAQWEVDQDHGSTSLMGKTLETESYLLLTLIAIAQQQGSAHTGLELQYGSFCSCGIQKPPVPALQDTC